VIASSLPSGGRSGKPASEFPLPLANLQELFGDRYVVGPSPEYEGRRKIPADPFFQVIRCRGGVLIWPYGAELLGATVKGVLVDRLLATGVILEDKSAICRDEPEAWKKSDVARRFGRRYETACQWNNRPTATDLESNLVFHVQDFEVVAEIVGARKRRPLSPEQRARQIETLRRWREGQDKPQTGTPGPMLPQIAR